MQLLLLASDRARLSLTSMSEENNKEGTWQEGLITPLDRCGSKNQSHLLRGEGTVPSCKDTLSNSKLVLVTSLTTFLAQDKSKRQQESLVNYLDSCYPDGQVEAEKQKAIEPYIWNPELPLQICNFYCQVPFVASCWEEQARKRWSWCCQDILCPGWSVAQQ